MTNTPIVNVAGFKYIEGLKISYLNAAQITVLSGGCRGTNNINDITIAENLILGLDFVGVNGLDQGVKAGNTIYAVYAIGDSTLFKEGATIASAQTNEAPILPFGYDMHRRIGYVVTDNSANIRTFSQTGHGSFRICSYETPVHVLVDGTSATYASVALIGVPATSDRVVLNYDYTPTLADSLMTLRAFGSANVIGNVGIATELNTTAHSQANITAGLEAGVPTVQYVVGSGAGNIFVDSYYDEL